MALVPKDSGDKKERPPWRGVVFGVVAAAAFVIALSSAAWLTRDTPNGVPHREKPDAGFPDAGFPDAGPADVDAGPALADEIVDGGEVEAGAVVIADAGARLGPEAEPDAGTAAVGAAGPPVDAGEVAALVAPVVERCLKEALRFDPALGGKAVVHTVAARGGLSMTMPPAPSPVLSSCVLEKGKLGYAGAPEEPAGVDVHLALDGLRGTASVTQADLVAP